MNVAITGARGLFGYGLVEVAKSRHKVYPLTRADADITRPDEVRAVFRKLRPEVIIHPAGIPDLDLSDADPDQATLVNYHGTRHVVEAAHEIGAAVAYISTDAVFDGRKRQPYTESDPPNPLTVYGRTKWQGELATKTLPKHWIFRVPVLFGPGKTNFVEKGLRKLAGGELYVVAMDQMGSATYTLDAAAKILELIEARRYGLYHLANRGACSRYDLGVEAARLAGLDTTHVIGKPDAEMGRRVPRLKYSVMAFEALEKAGFAPPRPWQEALAEYVRSVAGSLARH